MTEEIVQELSHIFPEKSLLTLEDVCTSLECDEQTIYNWAKRSDPKRQPPRIMVGKKLRFPKRDFVRWLVEEQAMGAFCGV